MTLLAVVSIYRMILNQNSKDVQYGELIQLIHHSLVMMLDTELTLQVNLKVHESDAFYYIAK